MNRFVSVFSQLLQLFPRIEFQRAVQDHQAERHARGFTCWGQFVAMLFCQLGRAKSLREICGGLACAEGKLSHLGITAPKRTTLAYANEHRPWQLYQTVFLELLTRARTDPFDALGRRRDEHEDNANAMGRVAGRNMAGAVEKYDYLPYFYSDLFDFGYEAVGEMDRDAEQIMEWKRPFEEGTLYYVKHSRLRGVLYWNTFGQVDAGRALIADQRVASMTEHLVPVH